MKSGITRRWLQGSLAFTVLMVLIAEVLFIVFIHQYYYGSVRQRMEARFSSMMGQLSVYSLNDDTAAQEASRSQALHRMVEQFADKDKYEFMLLDSSGGVLATSSGTSATGIVSQKDFSAAQENGSFGAARYTTDAGEKVMAGCALLTEAADGISAVRLVTSLTLVDRVVNRWILISVCIAAVIIAVSVLSGMFFVRSIVRPLGDVERAASGIAQGNLEQRLPEQGDPRDEIDRLKVSINRMAEGLAETENMKNEFISSVSHELRTPLTSIRGWVETLQTIDDPQDASYRKGLAIIGSETDRLYNMVEELLDFSRLQNGRIKLNMQKLDLVAEVTDAVLFLQPRCEQAGILLSYDEPEELIPVRADPDRLRQVLINVLDNAVKYSVAGGRITIKVWAGDERSFIEIIDQGRGIPPEDLGNVRTKFYKGSNSVRGSGIGLALVDELMTGMEGGLDIRSTLGHGTVVTLDLPLYRIPPAQV